MKVLLLGCGKVRKRNIRFSGGSDDFSGDDLTTIDMDPSSNPDIVMDLGVVPNGDSLPFSNDVFDEIHAYDILEHIGSIGDWRGFFNEFGEYHRVLKSGGLFHILVPIGEDAFVDPGHARFFHQNHFFFLSQTFYKNQDCSSTTRTDYRWYWKKDFKIEHMENIGDHHLAVILRKQ